jgi:hypothetical protein
LDSQVSSARTRSTELGTQQWHGILDLRVCHQSKLATATGLVAPPTEPLSELVISTAVLRPFLWPVPETYLARVADGPDPTAVAAAGPGWSPLPVSPCWAHSSSSNGGGIRRPPRHRRRSPDPVWRAGPPWSPAWCSAFRSGSASRPVLGLFVLLVLLTLAAALVAVNRVAAAAALREGQ